MRRQEVKKVEFGTKANKMQGDGINFIQRLSFGPFNERTQFKNSIYQSQQLTGIKARKIEADAIDATKKIAVQATLLTFL
ncbi:MAG: hypothetical protein AAF770_02790 [Bacteroidota bacterium]